jgi:hypothetical protein
MEVELIPVTPAELEADRSRLLKQYSDGELTRRVRAELATAEDRAALERLDEIAFLLGEHG